jgi:hypothetical protein
MSVLWRPAVVIFLVGSLLTGYFIFATSHFSGFLTARTPYGRLFGLLGFATIMGSSVVRLWERQAMTRNLRNDWHSVLGLLSLWLILLHSHLHFGNAIATLAFILLVLVVMSGAVATWVDRHPTSASPQAVTGRIRSTPVTQRQVRRERWVLFHIVVTVGLLTVSLFHILTILYY